MCGRFTLYSPAKDINQYFEVNSKLELKPRYNITPASNCPIVRINHNERELAECHWGLIPHWAKDTKLQPINAKAATVKDKPYFRGAYKKQRCLVPANGYYEWKGEQGRKQPYYIRPLGMYIFAFAGLWDTWEGPDKTIESFTIITTSANQKTAKIHDRMPVILAKDGYDRWLVDGNGDLLRPCPDDAIETYRVSSQVNKPGNDGDDLIKPVSDIPPLVTRKGQ